MTKVLPQKIYFFILLVLAVSTPLGLETAAHIAAALLVFCWFLNRYFVDYRDQFKARQVWLPALIYLLAAIGFFFSNDKPKALSYLSVYLPYLMPVFILVGPSFSIHDRNKLLRTFIISLVVFLFAADVYAITDMLISGQSEILLPMGSSYLKYKSYGLTRIIPGWHPTIVSLFAVWSIAFMITLRLFNKTGLFKIAIEISLIVFLFINIILLNSLSAIGALFIVLTWWLVQFLRKRINLAWIILISAILIAAFSFLVYQNPFHNEKLDSLKERGFKITDLEGERNLFSIRVAKWVSHIEIFEQHPVFGVTPGDMEQQRKAVYAKRGFTQLLAHNYNAHNQFLEILCRFGIVGFLVFIFFLASGFSNSGSKQLYIPFILSTSIICLTESYLEIQLGLMSFMFMFCVLTKKLEREVTS